MTAQVGSGTRSASQAPVGVSSEMSRSIAMTPVVVEQPLLHGRIGQECSLLLDRRRSVVLLQAPSIRRAVLVP
ncbi:hypothetical protein BIU89_10820 [Curtobacterium sp. MCBA15_005]|nr:hypothetical protein BIU89_10820 [Curtobacterium sp. MCBA15_005]